MKRLAVLTALFLLFIGTSPVFHNVLGQILDDAYLSVNESYVVEQDLVSESNLQLIPKDAIAGVGDTYYLDYTYTIAVENGADLEVVIETIVFTKNGETMEDTENIVYIEPIVTRLTENTSHVDYEVTLRVRLNNPTSQALFETIAGASVRFTVNFKAVNAH